MGKVKEFSIAVFSGAQSGVNNLVYRPGSVVEGHVVLEISTPQNTKDISLIFLGEAGVTRRGYRDFEVILHWTFRLWGNGRDPQQLASGRYEFLFSFQLPSAGLLSSYEYKRNVEAYIRYVLTATFSRPWKSKRYTSTAITVEDIVNVNTPRLSVPLSCSRIRYGYFCHCGLTSGPISMTVTTDRGGYLPGESIDVNIKVENCGNRRIIAIQVILKRVAVYHARKRASNMSMGGAETCSVRKCQCISWFEGPGTEARGEINWNNDLPIPATTPTISGCRIIKLSYILNVKLLVSWASDLCVNIPIVIGSVRFQREQSAMARTNVLQSPNTNTLQPRPAATNSGSMTFQSQRSASTNPQPTVAQPPVSTEDDPQNEQIGETTFTPESGLVTNYNLDIPPSYNSIFHESSL